MQSFCKATLVVLVALVSETFSNDDDKTACTISFLALIVLWRYCSEDQLSAHLTHTAHSCFIWLNQCHNCCNRGLLCSLNINDCRSRYKFHSTVVPHELERTDVKYWFLFDGALMTCVLFVWMTPEADSCSSHCLYFLLTFFWRWSTVSTINKN